MGQQQLLLLVLGIVIVGLAVVAGINAFSENQEKSTKDAIVNEGMRLATDIQAWRLKPSAFGGGGGDEWPADMSVAGAESSTPWGDVTISESADDGEATVQLTATSVGQQATITVPRDGAPTFNDDWGPIATPPSGGGGGDGGDGDSN